MAIESIVNNPILTLGSLTIAAISIILSIIFFIKSKKEKIPCYYFRSNTLIEGINKKLPDLQINYKDHPQERITITKFIIWNNGKQTIDVSDVVLNNPLKIKYSKAIEILDIQLIKLSDNSNSVEIKDNIIQDNYQFNEIIFDFLDYKDYIIIQIVHNGDEKESFEFTGKIKGVKKIIKPSEEELSLSGFIIDVFGVYEIRVKNPIVTKYLLSSLYFIMGLIGLFLLLFGGFNWFFLFITCVGFIGSGIMCFAYNYFTPEKL